MDFYRGMKLRASWRVGFVENMKKLQMKKLEVGKKEGRENFGKRKETNGKNSQLSKYYEAVGRMREGRSGVPIMSKSDDRPITNIPISPSSSTSPSLNHELVALSSLHPSFGFYEDGPKATATTDPFLSFTDDHQSNGPTLIHSQEKSKDTQ